MVFSSTSLSKAERYCRRHSQHTPLYIYYNPDTDTYDVFTSRYAAMPWQTLISSYYMGTRVSQSYATITRPPLHTRPNYSQLAGYQP